MLLQEHDKPGLEVWSKSKNIWTPIAATEGTLVVNIGDVLQSWTGAYLHSARHRVINVGTQHRYSVPIFYMGNLDAQFKPVGLEENNLYRVEANRHSNDQSSEPATVASFLMRVLQQTNKGDQNVFEEEKQ